MRISRKRKILAGDAATLVITIGNFAADAFNGRVTVLVDRKFSFDQETDIAPWSEGKGVGADFRGRTGIASLRSSPAAGRAGIRQSFFLTFAVQEKGGGAHRHHDGTDGQKSGALIF